MASTDDIFKHIQKFLQSSPTPKKEPDYLGMKNGILPLTASFNSSPDPQQQLPCLKIGHQPTDHIYHSAGSDFHPTTYSL